MPSVTYLLGDLIVDYAQRRMTVAGVPVKLTVIKYRLLANPSANTSLISDPTSICCDRSSLLGIFEKTVGVVNPGS